MKERTDAILYIDVISKHDSGTMKTNTEKSMSERLEMKWGEK